MKNKEKTVFKRADFVSYYDGGYTGRYINEDGEMDIWDWHLYSSGKVLCVDENKKEALVLFYSKVDENPRPICTILLNEVFVDWVSFGRLKKEIPKETAFEIWSENEQDLGDYPDGFNPNLYNL
jgi:hypothetical protein